MFIKATVMLFSRVFKLQECIATSSNSWAGRDGPHPCLPKEPDAEHDRDEDHDHAAEEAPDHAYPGRYAAKLCLDSEIEDSPQSVHATGSNVLKPSRVHVV